MIYDIDISKARKLNETLPENSLVYTYSLRFDNVSGFLNKGTIRNYIDCKC